ncbi:S8 family serine peptidase [Chungangia koreensis]|uniref:S8 family serine peptidase n=1 Tax=Chungangia koreensis TaxID=752657 RepID=A0ABV8X205_9LACT
MRTYYRTLLMTVLFVLMLNSIASAMNGSRVTVEESLSIQKPVPSRLLTPEDPHELVRIIVELEQEPTIKKATKKGVLYKELKPTERVALEKGVLSQQETVQEKIQSEAPSIEYLSNFTTVFNGFSAEVEAEHVEKIAKIEGIKAVYEATEYSRPVEKPEMVYSKELIQTQQAWNDYAFKGEGMVVGIIDTGIDITHKDMVLTDEKSGEITAEQVNSLLAKGSIEAGKYYTPKIPFGYNYMDDNDIIIDSIPDASMHGMHVAGIVGANGNEENGGIQGVAPEAQLLALKVFGNDPEFQSTFGDIYIEAIDDAIKLGADVINMSLGSTAGFVDANHPEQQAVKRAVDNGVLVAISTGNSALFGDGYFFPYTENQDYGLTGSPGISEHSLSVASFENSMLTAYSFNYFVNGEEVNRALYLLANSSFPDKLLTGPMEVVDTGFGTVEDFKDKDVKDKIALISRGEIPFVEKGLNAQAAGAAGVMIYNNTEGTVNMISSSVIQIPYMSILMSDGLAMKEHLDLGQNVTVEFDGQFIHKPNPLDGKMSDFTSWGPTPNLDFKPEITAPGGSIFSTLNNNQYGMMSGTSMAAPHVAGGAALVFERVDNEFGLTGSERVELVKNLLMNTAKPIEFEEGEFISPRRQGAGLIQLANALSTEVVVTNEATGEAKVALKEIFGNTATFTLDAKNYSDKEITYHVDVGVQVDQWGEALGYLVTSPNEFGSNVVTDEVNIDTLEFLTVPANGSITLNVSIEFSGIEYLREYFTNGYFVDGFVILTDLNEEVSGNVPLVVPFFGFNGGWDDAPLFDHFAWDPMSFWGYTALVDRDGNYIVGGKEFNLDRFGFSPNNDGLLDEVIPVFSLLRNAKEFRVEVTDHDGQVLRTLRTAKELRKHYSNTTDALPYSFNLNYGWDGMVNNIPAVDDQYFIKLSGVIDYPGAEWQSIIVPVKIDTIAPIASAIFNSITQTVELVNIDDGDGTGIEYWEVLVNGEIVSGELDPGEEIFVLDQDLMPEDTISVALTEHAKNTAEVEVTINDDEVETDGPIITIDSPVEGSIHNISEITVTGSIEDESTIEHVLVNENEAEVTNATFTHTLKLEDGPAQISVQATDRYGNIGNAERTVYVDTTAPLLEINTLESDEESINFLIRIKDNYKYIVLRVNGDQVYTNDATPDEIGGFEEELPINVPVTESGVYLFEVEDIAGNITNQRVVFGEGKYEELLVPSTINMVENQEVDFTITYTTTTAEGTTSEDVTKVAEYSIDNPVIVLNSVKGTIKAKAPGTAEVTVKYSNLEERFTVNVMESEEPQTEQVLVLQDSTFSMLVGNRITIKANLITIDSDGNQIDIQDISSQLKFKDFDDQIIEIEDNDVIGKAVGKTAVTAYYDNLEATVIVAVQRRPRPNPAPDPKPPTPPTSDQLVDEQVKIPNTQEVKVEAPAPTISQPTVKTELTSKSMKALADSGKSLIVKAGNIEVDVPSSVIKSINLGANEKVSFQIELVNDAKVNTLGILVSDVFDFSISITGNQGTRGVSNFAEPITVIMPIKSFPEDHEKVAAYYLNEETGRLDYSGGIYSDHAIRFKTRHFSKFVAVESYSTFADIHNHWAKNEIEVLASRKITSGTAENVFSPDDEMTRAQFAVLLARALNLPNKSFEGIFKDIPEHMEWGNVEIEAAYRAGIIKGKSAGIFEPNLPITREQMALMMIRAIEYQNPDQLKGLNVVNEFNDIGGVNPNSLKSIEAAASLGLLTGFYDGTFRPRDFSTRAQTSVVLYRLLKQLGEI